MRRNPWSSLLVWLLPLASGLLFLVAWAVLKHAQGFPKFFLPYPWEVAAAGWAERSRLFEAAASTLSAAVIGFVGAAVAGGAIAIVLASSRWVRATFYPHVLIVQMIPIVVLAPLFVLWFRAGIHSVSAITFAIGFFPVVANATQGLISTDRGMVELFQSTGAGFIREFVFLRMPFALPYYLTGLRISASLAMIGAVTGELFAGSASGGTGGLGFMVIVYHAQLRTAEVLATGFMACLCGFVFVGTVHLLNWLLLRQWHDSFERSDT